MKIYGNMWPRCPECCSVSLSWPEMISIYYFCKYMYVLTTWIIAFFTPISCQTEVDAQTDDRSLSHACKRAGSMSFLLFIAMPPSTEPGASGDQLFQMWENSCLKMKSTERKAKLRDGEERQSTGDIVQTLRSCHDWRQHTPLDIPFVSQ